MEWVRPVPKAPERSWHASGPSFRPNRRFSTHFGPFSMIWARTDIVDPTWTSRTRPGTAPWSGLDPSQRLRNGPGMLLDQVSGQTVDSGPIRLIFYDLGPNRHFGPDLDLQDQARDWLGSPGPSHTFLFLTQTIKPIFFCFRGGSASAERPLPLPALF